jgi:quercetin dioxygenase-like cupin family protein
MKPLPLIRLLTLALALAAFGPTAALAESANDMVMVVPTDLKWVDAKSAPPGAKMAVIEGTLDKAVPFTFRVKFPANYKLPAHWHPAIEHVTVISGTFNMGMGDKLDPEQTTALTPGSVAIMQPKTNHFAWTGEETEIQVHGVGPWGINYVNPEDDPRKKQRRGQFSIANPQKFLHWRKSPLKPILLATRRLEMTYRSICLPLFPARNQSVFPARPLEVSREAVVLAGLELGECMPGLWQRRTCRRK